MLALLAGRGFELASRPRWSARCRASSGASGSLPQAASSRASSLAPLAITAHSHPFGLSTYVPLVGGRAGGADLGLNRQFWGYTTENAAAEYLNAKAPRGATVFIHDTTWDAWAACRTRAAYAATSARPWRPHEAQFSLVQHELHMNEVDYDIWVAFGTDAPVYMVQHDGVPIVSIYKRP